LAQTAGAWTGRDASIYCAKELPTDSGIGPSGPKAETNGRTFHAMFYFRAGDKAKPFFSSKWPTTKNARGLIFFYQDPETKRLRLHSIRDFLE